MKRRKVGYIKVDINVINNLKKKFSRLCFCNVRTGKHKIFDIILAGEELSKEEKCLYDMFNTKVINIENYSFNNCIEQLKEALKIHRELSNKQMRYIRVVNKFQIYNEQIDSLMKVDTNHALKVAYNIKVFADKVNADNDIKLDLYIGAMMHDVGKIKVDSRILSKSTKLTKKEYEKIKKHSIYGYEMLKGYLPETIRLMIKYHHRRENNGGYPEDDEDVSVWTKVISISDSFDAMTSDRVYNTKLTKSEGINELLLCTKDKIEGGKGIQFDPYLTELFIKTI